MDRGEIERHDFPTGRRGYDPASVDEHLRRVADEFERLGGRAPAGPTLAGGTSEEVRLILEAAERGAGALMARAGEQASDHVERVRAAADGLLGKLDTLETELNGLLDGLRASGERLTRGLDELQADAATAAGRAPQVARDDAPARGADEPGEGRAGSEEARGPEAAAAGERGAALPPADEPDAMVPPGGARGEAPQPADHRGEALPPADHRGEALPPAGDPDAALPPAGDRTEALPPAGDRGDPPPQASGDPDAAPPPLGAEPLRDADEAGARLIALNMALGGTPREEAARYLAEHYALQDPEGLLDDVYSRAER